MNQALNISIQTTDPTAIELLFGAEKPASGASHLVDEGIEISYRSQSSKPGMLTTEFMVNLVINLGVGVSSGLVAAWIYENLCKQGENKVLVKEERVILVTKEDVEVFIREKIERET